MPISQRPSVVAAAGLLLLAALTGCTLAGANPAPLTPVSPDQVPEFEPIVPESEGEQPGAIPSPTQLAPVDVMGTQTAQPPAGEAEGETPGAEATPLGEATGETPAEATPVPVVEATAAPPEGTCPVTHTVQQGETLYSLSRHYGVSVSQIVAASNLANPDRLSLGQELTIPCPDGAAPSAGDDAPPPAGASGTVHTVQPGENLFRIAMRYGLTVDELARHNNISDPTRISVGQQLRIP